MARASVSAPLLVLFLAVSACGLALQESGSTTITPSPGGDSGIVAHTVVQAGAKAQPGKIQPGCAGLGCKEDEYCETTEAPVACRPVLLPGMPCKDTYQCAAFLYCDASLDPAQCRKAPGKNGNCEDTGGICAEGFFCDVVHSPAKCRDPKEAGKPCSLDAGCADGLYCDLRQVKSVCTPLTTSECDLSTLSQCPEGQFCAADHDPALCLPLGKKGEGCEDNSSCKEGLVCIVNPKTERKICKPAK